jgi:hypothetical protein
MIVPRRRRTPWLVSGLLLAAACSPLLPTPDDFPGPQITPIVEFPTTLPAMPTTRPIIKAIVGDDMAEARTFFLILQVSVAAGDSTAFAERVLYPIQVRMGGGLATILSADEFQRNHDAILSDEFLSAMALESEDDLELQLDGIRAAGGALWFNQFCGNSTCSESRFLITQINS